MTNEELTKDAKYLLAAAYSQYLKEIKLGASKSKAKNIGHAQVIKDNLMTDWQFEDVSEICFQLKRAGFFNTTSASNIAFSNSLSDKALIYMENKFKNNLSAVLKSMKEIKDLIPFI